MKHDADLELELGELALLLEDPQVREFLLFYLRIREPAARAHLRRVVAEIATVVPPRASFRDGGKRRPAHRHGMRRGKSEN